jgi:hypothetical protein
MSEIIVLDTKLDFRTLPKPNKKQRRFIELWLDPSNHDTFGNAYESAKQAGFSDSYARIITGNALNVEWVQQAKELLVGALSPEHIYQGLQHIALNSKQDRDRLRALELMAKVRGMFIERTQSQVNVTFTNNVPRPVVDIEPTQ